LPDVFDAALALAGEPLSHLREPVGRREAHDPANRRGHRDRLGLAVGLRLVRILPGVEREAIAHEGQPLWIELRWHLERTAGERPVVLLELGEGAVREHLVTFGAEEL